MKILVMSELAVMRTRLVKLLASVAAVRSIWVARSAAELLREIAEHSIDMLILEASFNIRESQELVRLAAGHSPRPLIIVFSSFVEEPVCAAFRHSGADYFFPISEEFDRLVPLLNQLRLPAPVVRKAGAAE